MKTYLDDFKEKFPYRIWSDTEICEKHCVNEFYQLKSAANCREMTTYKDCEKCWNKEKRI